MAWIKVDPEDLRARAQVSAAKAEWAIRRAHTYPDGKARDDWLAQASGSYAACITLNALADAIEGIVPPMPPKD